VRSQLQLLTREPGMRMMTASHLMHTLCCEPLSIDLPLTCCWLTCC
jgi:hypothetical protein